MLAILDIAKTLEAVLEGAPGFFIVVDQAGTIQYINRVLPQYTRDQVIGSDWLSYVAPAEHDEQRARLRDVFEGAIAATYETTVSGPGGETLWFSSRIGPMRQDGQIVGAILITQDITELRRTQAEFATSQRLAAVGTLAAGVAHEINTPVQFVGDSLAFLREASTDLLALVGKLQDLRGVASARDPSPALQKAIGAARDAEEHADLAYLREHVPLAFDRCVEGLERVATIVRSLKEFSHPDQGVMTPLDLNHAIENALTIARSEYRHVADVAVDFGEIPAVTCYANDINQVFLNLIVNAAHAIADAVGATQERGTIRVCTRRAGDDVTISISDTGRGIPAEIASRVFEPFFTTKAMGKGTGQGLALAWAIVTKKHGGQLTFESRQGEGTTFLVRLPSAGARPLGERESS